MTTDLTEQHAEEASLSKVDVEQTVHFDRQRDVGTCRKIPKRRGAEYYDEILWRLRSRMDVEADRGFTVGFTSCRPSSGVSTVATNVAIRAADHNISPVLVVDANFQRPMQGKFFKVVKGAGLIDVLTGRSSIADAVRSTMVDGLDVIPLGSKELLDQSGVSYERLASLMKELQHEYALIVVDLANAYELGHGLLLAEHLDAALLVVKSDTLQAHEAKIQLNRLFSDGLNVVGAVVTGQRSRRSH